MNIRLSCEACHSKNLLQKQIGSQSISLEQLTSNSFQVTNKDYGISLETVWCQDCGLWQPRYCVAFEDVTKFYAKMEDSTYLESSSRRGLSNYKQIQDTLKKYTNQNDQVLEIGAGGGAVINFLKKDGFNAEGLEPNRQFCEFAKEKYGISLMDIPYELLDKNGRYKAVIAFDVIEHLASPAHFLDCIHGCLVDSGIAIIVTPNKSSITARMMKKKWWHIRPPHLFYFDDKNISILAEKHHFKVVQSRQFYWSLPLSYLVEVFQKFIFNRSFVRCPWMSVNIKVNLFDSKVYILQKVGE
jgi:SAM-dependent methyltransferase